MDPEIDLDRLVKEAWTAREKAYAPYSHFLVGAALLARSGDIFCGCNIENVSFSLTICAERNALFSAVQRGVRDFVAMAIAAGAAGSISPCGACRQVLAEFAPNLLVVSEGQSGERSQWKLAALLPAPFASNEEFRLNRANARR